jgi:hypothetical protein
VPFVVALWLALLQALSPVPSSLRSPDGGARGAHVGAARSVGDERRLDAGPARRPHEALASARVVAEAALTRATPPTPPQSGTAPAALGAPAWPARASEARRALRHHGACSHAPAARGGLLAYVPTAPPRLG